MKSKEQKRIIPANCGKAAATGQIVNVRKTYPNDPCPCGSGKKFKYCCRDDRE